MGSDALPSSSPSLIWLQLEFGLAGAVTKAHNFPDNLGLLSIFETSSRILNYHRSVIFKSSDLKFCTGTHMV